MFVFLALAQAVKEHFFDGELSDEAYQALLHQSKHRLGLHPGSVTLVRSHDHRPPAPQPPPPGRLRQERYRRKKAEKIALQKEVTDKMKEAVRGSAAIVHHVGYLSAGSAARANRMFRNVSGGRVRTSLGVALPSLLPSNREIRAAERSLVDSGVVQRLEELQDGQFRWARAPLVESIQRLLQARHDAVGADLERLAVQLPHGDKYHVHLMSWLDGVTTGSSTARTRCSVWILDPNHLLFPGGVSQGVVWFELAASIHESPSVSSWRARDLHRALVADLQAGPLPVAVDALYLSGDHEALAVENGCAGGSTIGRCSACTLPLPLAPYASRCGADRRPLPVARMLFDEQQLPSAR